MFYDVMSEYEIKRSELARAYRAGRASGKATREIMAGAWRWFRGALNRDERRELIAERA